MAHPPIVLASGSPYRAAALRRLGLEFAVVTPGVEEVEISHETPPTRALRLAREKCLAGVQEVPEAIVIGSDQVGVCGSELLHKPGDENGQIQSLTRLSGNPATFFTALAVWDPSSERVHAYCDTTVLQFRQLNPSEIQRYVRAEPATDCAGGFKVEGLGISLFERIENDDPSALIGMPLIALTRILDQLGVFSSISQ